MTVTEKLLFFAITNSAWMLLHISSVQFSHSEMFDYLHPHGLQHARIACPSPTSRACSNSCPSSRWCHPTISSSVAPFSSCLQSFPASGSFPMSQFFASGGQSIRISYMTTGKTIALTRWIFVGKVMSLVFNMLSRLVITFLPRTKRLLISWLQSPSAVIMERPPQKKLSLSLFPLFRQQTMSPLDWKEIKPVNPKGNQSWIFIGRTDAEAESPMLWLPDAKNWLIGKDLDAGKDWRQEEKGTTEDEIVGWHYRPNGHEYEQALGVGEGQGSLVCCRPWGCKESDMTE